MAGPRLTFNGVETEQILADTAQGVEANLDDGTEVLINGVPMKKAELLAEIAAYRKPYLAVDAARNELEAKIVVRDEAAPDALDFVKKLDAGITAKVGTDANEKAKYGLPKPRARRALTAEQQVKKVAKMLATRKMRGTMGRRQKQGVKAAGEFNVTVGPATSAAATAPASTSDSSVPASTPAPAATLPTPTANPAPVAASSSAGTAPAPAATEPTNVVVNTLAKGGAQ